jgi:IS1 family transposase
MGMNKLPPNTRVQILNMLCEGLSMRSISRVCDVSVNTVSKLLVDAGEACAAYHHEHVRNVQVKRVQYDEIWSFCYSTQKNLKGANAAPFGSGNVWTWTALDSDSKMILSWMVGGRDSEFAMFFIDDLKDRLAGRVQLTTDGHRPYLEGVAGAFCESSVDYATLVKLYGETPDRGPKRKYSPAECYGARTQRIRGNPDPKHIGTLHVERTNLNIRMGLRRFTRLTNAFSKKIDNHIHALSLYFVWYNFCRMHKSLGGISPAMAAGISDTLYDMEWIVGLIEARAPKPGRPKTYKKRAKPETSN